MVLKCCPSLVHCYLYFELVGGGVPDGEGEGGLVRGGGAQVQVGWGGGQPSNLTGGQTTLLECRNIYVDFESNHPEIQTCCYDIH